ncbi:MAG: VCBS repeat-containing protein [Bacteroidota bacterium]
MKRTNDSTFVMKPTMLDGITNNSFYVGEARWVDINSDGYLDIFMAGLSGCDSYTGLTSLLLNDKHGFFDIGLAGLRLPAFHEYVDISFGDLDLDGTPDLTVYGATQGYGSRFFTFFYQNNNFRDSKIDYIISGDDDNNIDLGDVDNDGDLDLAVNGERRTPPYNNEEVVYRNNIVGSWGKTNNSPSVPTNLQIQQSGNDLVLSWSPSNDDHTPVKSITYEAFVMLGNDTITSSNSNLGDGTRKISLVGNLGNRTTQTFKIHKNGTVRWGVQAIDGSYRASAFAMSPDFEATGINDNNDEGDGDGDGDGDEGDGDDGEVTGLKDEQISIDVYPNPAKQNIYVRGGVDVPQVYNVVGQQLDLPVNPQHRHF